MIITNSTEMANCRSVVKHYENLTVQQLSDLWNQFYRKGPTLDILRDILMFYIHHKNFPPVMQKSCDSLLSCVHSKDVSKKLRNVIFQIIEEVGVCLESSIVEQITFSTQKNIHTELFTCILVGGLVPLLDENTIEKLCSFLYNTEIPVEERGKVLMFLLAICESCPSLFSSENASRIAMLMDSWFRHVQNKPVTTSVALFGRSDSNIATEVDGTTAGDVFTVLTLSSNFNEYHMMGIHGFSLVREWLKKKIVHQNRKFTEGVREYCSLVVEQCLRPAQKEHDIILQKAVLCEVLDIMIHLVQLDSSHAPHCLIIVKRVENSVKDHFKNDYRDVCIFVRVLTFLLHFGESTGYNSQLICEHFLQHVIYRTYSSGLAVLDTIIFLLENKHKMIALQKPLLQRFFPNIFKIIAFHPSVVIEEFVELMPAFIYTDTAVEVFHTIIDLPLLAATLCMHQAPVLAKGDNAGSMDTRWVFLLSSARSLEFQPTFSYMMRVESSGEFDLEKMSIYMKLLQEISNHSLVVTCSQIVPLLLETYYRVIEKWEDVSSISPVVLAMLSRMFLLYDVSDYVISIHRCLLIHIKLIFKKFPGLIFAMPTELIKYVSSLKNYNKFPPLYIHTIYIIGEYTHISDCDNQQQLLMTQYYEVLECLIYEILAQIATKEEVSLELINVASSALAKLASKCQDPIPRAVLCLNKIRMQFVSCMSSDSNEELLIICDRMEELLCILQNPNVANMVWSSRPCHNTSVTSFVQVLSHVTDS